MTVAGVDLGGSKIAGVLLDESGTVRGELWQEHRIQGPDQAVELIGEVVGELMADLISGAASRHDDIDPHDFRWERFATQDLLTSPHPYAGAEQMR